MNNNFGISVGNIDFSYRSDRQAPEHLNINHCHDTYEILFVQSGTGKYVVEGSTFPIRSGTLMVIRPFEYHCVQIEPGSPYERYVINFSRAALSEDAAALFDAIMKADGASGRFYSSGTLPGSLMSVFERFEIGATLPQNEKQVFLKTLLSELVVFLSVSDGEQIAHDEGELGARVIRYLNENIDKNISLDKLARRFFVSKYYLCRAFKTHNGISVHGYINQKRVMYAKQLIESGETASGAAYRVGFGDYSAFYRAYVKIVGKAPTAN